MEEQNDIQQDSLFSIVPGGGHEASDIVAYKIQMISDDRRSADNVAGTFPWF